VGRLFGISAAAHVVILLFFAFMPNLIHERELGMDVYAVELVDVSSQPAPTVEPTAEADVVEEPPPEPEVEEAEPEPEIPEEPAPRPQKTVRKLPPRPEERSLADKIADRLEKNEPVAPIETQTEETVEAPAQTSEATIRASSPLPSWYLSGIKGKVERNWKQPSARLIADEVLTVVVSFRIRRDGSAEAITIRRSSGRPTVDQSAAKAIRTAAPFPPLGSIIPEDYLDVTIDFKMTRD
jgi:protein TonB